MGICLDSLHETHEPDHPVIEYDALVDTAIKTVLDIYRPRYLTRGVRLPVIVRGLLNREITVSTAVEFHSR
jgi:hypothetical protein